MKNSNDRIVSLEYMRAIACILVIIGHTILIGCLDAKTIGVWVPSITVSPYPTNFFQRNIYADLLISIAVWFGINVGHLGVALFFILSGFVILRSLDREDVWTFAVRRTFRILPCCAAAVVATSALVAVVCRADGVSSPLTLGDGLASATVTMNFLHRLPTMPVLWSLEVEIAFYAMMAMLAAAAGRIGTRWLFAAGLASSNLALVTLGLSRAPGLDAELALQLVHLSQILIYMPLMLVGAVAHRCWGCWRPAPLAGVAAAVAIFFSAYASYGFVAGWNGLGVDAVTVTLALALFAAALVWRRERGWLAPLRFVGAISYPLYLIHAPLGWIVLDAMRRQGFSVHAACAASILASVLAAWALHVLVERPGQRIGAALSTLFHKRRSLDPAAPIVALTAATS